MAKSRAYYQNTRSVMAEFLPQEYHHVLEVGCAEGLFSSNLDMEAEVWGVEMDPYAAECAKTRMGKVLVGTYQDVANQLPDDYFDLVICNDVIEHMQDHILFLQSIKHKITNGGCIVGSIPNVRYLDNLYELLVRRDWKYTDSDILDSTHLRFFTKKSLKRVLIENDYRIEVLKGINPFNFSRNILKNITKRILWGGLLLVTLFTYRDARYPQFGFRLQVTK